MSISIGPSNPIWPPVNPACADAKQSDRIAPLPANIGAGTVAPPAQAGARAMRLRLLGTSQAAQPERQVPTSAPKLAQALREWTATVALNNNLAGHLARIMLPPNAVVGKDGHTFADECALFPEFESPGFPRKEAAIEQAQALLIKAFGLTDASELPGALATAVMRTKSALYRLAFAAIESGAVPGHAPVGADSTLAQEIKYFAGSRIGF